MKKADGVIRHVYALCWLAHLRFLNRIVDNLYIQVHILSVYICYNGCNHESKNLKEIYTWFIKYFKTYYLPNDYWLFKFESNNKRKLEESLKHISSSEINKSFFGVKTNTLKTEKIVNIKDVRSLKDLEAKLSEINELISSYKFERKTFFLAMLIKRIVSSIKSGNCCSEISNIIFAALLRSLGFCCRLTMLVPPIINFKNEIRLNDNNRRPELWVEVFDSSFNKWISIDIYRGGWNFTGCKGADMCPRSKEHVKIVRKIKKNTSDIFSKLFLNIGNNSDSNPDSGSSDVPEECSLISTIPLKKVSIQERSFRVPIYEKSNDIELDEQRESLTFEFSNTNKLESLNLRKLKDRIDIAKTNIKYKAYDNIGWWIISINKNGYLKETTSRYASDWSQVIYSQLKNSNKTIIDNLILKLNGIYQNYDPRMLQLEILDDFELDFLKHSNVNIPRSRTAFKNHHKYAIVSCLNSLEIIHPKEPIVGYFQGEPIYPRENVQTLKTKSQWEQDQREIIPNQKPIRIVFRKRKNNTGTTESRRLEYFAEYQTQIKPILELNYNDKIPTNRYNSIDVSFRGNIPDSCVHIKESVDVTEVTDYSKSIYHSSWRIESLFDIIKNSKINFVKAFKGFDRYNNKPKYDGFVIKRTDLEYLKSLKNRKELTEMTQIAGFIWNDIFQNLKNILNDRDQWFNSIRNQENEEALEFKDKEKKYRLYHSTDRNVKKMYEKLFSDSLNIIEKRGDKGI